MKTKLLRFKNRRLVQRKEKFEVLHSYQYLIKYFFSQRIEFYCVFFFIYFIHEKQIFALGTQSQGLKNGVR